MEITLAIVTSPTGNSTPSTVLAGIVDWRDAVVALVNWFVANNRCFSSGEIAAYLRTYCDDLRFSVPTLGEYVRRWYDNNSDPLFPVPPTFPNYVDATGVASYPLQVARVTTGKARTMDGRDVMSRTPVGVTVFVYAPSGAEGYSHDFEILIPDPSDPNGLNIRPYTGPTVVAPVVTNTPATATQGPVTTSVPSPATANLIVGRLSAADLTAYVAKDGSGTTKPRVTVPRAAFEAFVALSGVPLRGGANGDPLHVTIDGSRIRISRDATPTSTEYHLWTNRGRLAISMSALVVGQKFKVTVNSSCIELDTSNPV